MRKRTPAIERVGEVHDRLTVLSVLVVTGRRPLATCSCTCGNVCTIPVLSLSQGDARSCGCLAMEQSRRLGQANKKHGMIHTSEYKAWSAMRDRCNNQLRPDYCNYGGRSITVCSEWGNFEKFLTDMGPKPGPDYSLDRKNNEKGYSKENCRWATKTEQTRNRRNTVRLTHGSETLTLAEWADRLEVSRGTLQQRHSLGWSDERILTQPVRARD